jgi:hypothetical protein
VTLKKGSTTIPITLSVNSNGDIVVNPNNDLTEFRTDYTLTVNAGITDTNGNLSTSSRTLSFTTKRFSALYWYSFAYASSSAIMAVSSSSNPNITFQAESGANSNQRSDFSIVDDADGLSYNISHRLYSTRKLEDVVTNDATAVQLTTTRQRTYKWYFFDGPRQVKGSFNTYLVVNKGFLLDTNSFLLGSDGFGVGKTQYATYTINSATDPFKGLYEIEIKRRGKK